MNATHSPVFHQTDGLAVWSSEVREIAYFIIHFNRQVPSQSETIDNLHQTMEELMQHLFGGEIKHRYEGASTYKMMH